MGRRISRAYNCGTLKRTHYIGSTVVMQVTSALVSESWDEVSL